MENEYFHSCVGLSVSPSWEILLSWLLPREGRLEPLQLLLDIGASGD
jgi:hypothetical protein